MIHDKESKISSVVLLRGFAALAVCCFHINHGVHFNNFADKIFKNGFQGVSLFFVISGFILPYSLFQKNYTIANFFKYVIKRSIRIDPPYWLAILLVFATAFVPISLLTFKTALLHLLYLVPFVKGSVWYCVVFWTLSIEFQFYLLLGLTFPFLIRIKPIYSITIVIVISVICMFFKLSYHDLITSKMYDFAMGFIIFMAYTEKITIKYAVFVLLLFCIYISYMLSFVYALIPIVTAIIILFYKLNKKIPLLYFIGEISYSFYLTHVPVSAFIILKLSSVINNSSILFVICLLASIGFSFLFYITVEKPSLSYSKRIRY